MNYSELPLKPSYESGIDNLVEDFYIPALNCAKRYDRITGFFSSTSIAIAARGILGLINNGGSMRMITCPKIDKNDALIMEQAMAHPEEIISKAMKDQLDSEDEFIQDHVYALGWLIAKGLLEIRIALVYNNGKLVTDELALSNSILHQKVGIMFDEDSNGISFSGSNNESASGWLNNVEEFKVFNNWDSTQKQYFESDYSKFERLWQGEHPSVMVYELPDAIKNDLIVKGNYFSKEKLSLQQYKKRNTSSYIPQKKSKEELKLFIYQEEAVKKWSETHNLLLEMATGCGKTRTAIGCLDCAIKFVKKPLLIIICCPGNTLSVQWKKDINQLNVPIDADYIVDGTNSKWHSELSTYLNKLAVRFYNNLILYTTHQTCSKEEFINLILKKIDRYEIFFIGDEVHGMGAENSRKGLVDSYKYRLGLSATPSRWFDDAGTDIIKNYFGNQSFVFTIHDALTTINPLTGKPFLVNYFYYPYFISLTEDELEDYKKLSDKIRKLSLSKDASKEELTEMLIFKRAEIGKSAENKYSELEKILDEIGDNISDTIIFVSPNQLDKVLEILSQRNIVAHSFTESESTKPSIKYNNKSEREFIIQKFIEKDYQVLVAIKCLDEGIDIPTAKRAIIMASSTNPREYVQRIGRVIRQASNKENAEIYDMIVRPNLSSNFDQTFIDLEKKLLGKELIRAGELSENAINNVQALNKLYKVKGET